MTEVFDHETCARPGGRRGRRAGPLAWPTARAVAGDAPSAPLPPAARPPAEALGLVLANPLCALSDLPPFDTSAMDGWAVSGPGAWRLDGVGAGILAGDPGSTPLPDGHAVAIATGARVPSGTTAVLRSEHGQMRTYSDGSVRLYAEQAVPPGLDVRPRGQECRRGETLLRAGALVTPAVLGLAAAAGYDDLTVHPRPRVDVIVLGDELLHSGLPRDGRIRDALGPMLGPWLRALGAEVGQARHLLDDADALVEAVAASDADLVVTTGGTAAGPVDHLRPTLEKLGAELLVDGVAVRPGHPMLLARLDRDRHLVGLPGNPLAAVSGLLTLAEPLLRRLAGRALHVPYHAPLTQSVPGHPRDTRLAPVAYQEAGDGEVTAGPLRFSGPAMLRGVAAADALAVITPGGVERGQDVELIELPWSLTGPVPPGGASSQGGPHARPGPGPSAGG